MQPIKLSIEKDNMEQDPPNQHDENSCPICLDSIGTKNCCTTDCGHCFHTSCLLKVSGTCPLCRSVLVPQPINAASSNIASSGDVSPFDVEMAELLFRLSYPPEQPEPEEQIPTQTELNRSYQLLEIPGSANLNQINRAYKTQFIRYHPGSPNYEGRTIKEQIEMFKNVGVAFETLSRYMLSTNHRVR